MNKHDIKARHKARELALQALYQWLIAQQPVEAIEAQFYHTNDMQKVDAVYFSKLLKEVLKNLVEIDAAFSPFLDRPFTDLHPVELSVLRMGSYELLFALEIPYRVVLDEAISLAKTFGAQDGYRYVNGVLNQLAKVARFNEVMHRHE